jgi:hypothetical protein
LAILSEMPGVVCTRVGKAVDDSVTTYLSTLPVPSTNPLLWVGLLGSDKEYHDTAKAELTT